MNIVILSVWEEDDGYWVSIYPDMAKMQTALLGYVNRRWREEEWGNFNDALAEHGPGMVIDRYFDETVSSRETYVRKVWWLKDEDTNKPENTDDIVELDTEELMLVRRCLKNTPPKHVAYLIHGAGSAPKGTIDGIAKKMHQICEKLED